MQVTGFEAEKRWGERTVREIERDLRISLELQWGPVWVDPARRRRARIPTSLQLILSRGRVRKIVWLDAGDMKAAASEVREEPAARQRIRSRVSDAIAAIANQLPAA
jgi:hypothetical protein